MKKKAKLSFKVKWILFKLNVANLFRVIFKKKIKKSLEMKRVLKSVFENVDPIEIPLELRDRGFYKLDENEDNIKLDDLINSTNLATVSIRKNNQEWELSVYDDVSGYEKTLIICYTQVFYNGNQIANGKVVGNYIDKTFSYQTQSEKVKKFIMRFALSSQK